ncbi:hypothetical protein JX265_004466 [Neoarthrinium moseri]|uniref:Helicase ATP-binding domain-containing protein n=1 Tax=Neoarthrinium moseri TaxID=1658444 RepID=A0A9P9WQZ2_9PEZI|nr:hypothetical protein JX265_004466 [Neoarthrinium moseri]
MSSDGTIASGQPASANTSAANATPSFSRKTTNGGKKSKGWKHHIKTSLKGNAEKRPEMKLGFFDPFTHPAYKTDDKVKRFYGGHASNKNHPLKGREKTARWLIQEFEKDYPICDLKGIGHVNQAEPVTYRVVGNPDSVHKGVVDSVGLDTQQDIDAETTTSTKSSFQKGITDEDTEHSHFVGLAAQAFLSGSPNCLGPPLEACCIYLQMEKIGDYGRYKLPLYQSPLFPRVRDSKDLEPEVDDDSGEEDEAEQSEDGSSMGDNADDGDYDGEHADAYDESVVGEVNCQDSSDSDDEVEQPSAPETTCRNGFLPNQVTAIVWILQRFHGELPKLKEFETAKEQDARKRLSAPRLFGGILADSMGLGKTRAVTAALELMAAHGSRVEHNKSTGQQSYRPMLVLCPNVTVAAQWAKEFVSNTSRHVIKKIVVGGAKATNYAEGKNLDDRVTHIEAEDFREWPDHLSYMWNTENPRASMTVLIMPIDTWSARTIRTRTEDGERYSTFTQDNRGFSVVCVDEAHKIKNSLTKNWRSVYLLERAYTLLVTATPCTNDLVDLDGLARVLWTVPEQYLRTKRPDLWRRIRGLSNPEDLQLLETEDQCSDFRLLAGKPDLLEKLLCKDPGENGHDFTDIRNYLHPFESLAILKRGPGSTIYTDFEKTCPMSLEGLLPNVENSTVYIDLDDRLTRVYQLAHADLLIKYLKRLRKWSDVEIDREMEEDSDGEVGEPQSLATLRRKLQIASASMDVYGLDKLFDQHEYGTKVTHIAEMRKNNVDFRTLAPFLKKYKERMPNTALSLLKMAVRNSPVLRYILHDIKNHILDRDPGRRSRRGRPGTPKEKIKKLLVTEASPVLAFYYELVFQLIGLNARTLHSDLSQNDRDDLIKSFNSDEEDSVQIFIQMYTVGFAGTNLHKNCSRVIIASQAHSLPVQSQAVHRVIRVGQVSDVKVFRLIVNNSYHGFVESRQIEKALPELAARAQGDMNHILVQLLNLFDNEITAAWKSQDGQKLITERDLSEPSAPKTFYPSQDSISTLSASQATQATSNSASFHADKKLKISTEEAKATSVSALPKRSESLVKGEIGGGRGLEDTLCDPATSASSSASKSSTRSVGGVYQQRIAHSEPLKSFLARKCRADYHEEFKALIQKKGRLDHKKNQLRRKLSYYKRDNPGRLWTLEELNKQPVLELALERVLQVRLGAEELAMLPIPWIPLCAISAKKKREVQALVSEITVIETDVNAADKAASDEAENFKIQEAAKNTQGQMLIEKTEEQVQHGHSYGVVSAYAKPEVGEERNLVKEEHNPEDNDNWRSMPVGNYPSTIDESGAPAEGKEPGDRSSLNNDHQKVKFEPRADKAELKAAKSDAEDSEPNTKNEGIEPPAVVTSHVAVKREASPNDTTRSDLEAHAPTTADISRDVVMIDAACCHLAERHGSETGIKTDKQPGNSDMAVNMTETSAPLMTRGLRIKQEHESDIKSYSMLPSVNKEAGISENAGSDDENDDNLNMMGGTEEDTDEEITITNSRTVPREPVFISNDELRIVGERAVGSGAKKPFGPALSKREQS